MEGKAHFQEAETDTLVQRTSVRERVTPWRGCTDDQSDRRALDLWRPERQGSAYVVSMTPIPVQAQGPPQKTACPRCQPSWHRMRCSAGLSCFPHPAPALVPTFLALGDPL